MLWLPFPHLLQDIITLRLFFFRWFLGMLARDSLEQIQSEGKSTILGCMRDTTIMT